MIIAPINDAEEHKAPPSQTCLSGMVLSSICAVGAGASTEIGLSFGTKMAATKIAGASFGVTGAICMFGAGITFFASKMCAPKDDMSYSSIPDDISKLSAEEFGHKY